MTLRRNAAFSVIEVVISGLGLFFIYRSVLAELGLSMLGVWSLVLATTAFGRMADVGIAAGLARFVAGALAEEAPEQAILYMRTAFIAVSGLMALVALVLWYPLSRALSLALSDTELALARDLLPWALLTFWALNLKGVLDACLIGAHRADLKSLATMAGMGLQITASLLLVSGFGLFGLAWAQAGQYALSIALSFAFIRFLPILRGGAGGWFSGPLFREMLGFGMKLQIGTIANLLFEPASKIVLGHVGGTAILGLYEMAYRMVYQARSVAIMAQSTVLPRLVELGRRADGDLRQFFLRTCQISALAAGGLMLATLAAAPAISWLWMGSINADFLHMTALLCLSWGINVLATPAYYLGIATGRVMPNVIGQLLAGILAPVLAYGLGLGFGAMAGIWGVAIGRLIADLLPAVYNRPDGRWDSAVISLRANLLAVLLIAAASTTLALSAVSLAGGTS
ncbi:MAG: oligosaccharide flippase family protein [Cypionkella sp.]|uniref:lipopolysaccharide biosynthesis protein n=1 Tax=Cypionkella sp. TaxID=2811411 RepID=UPI002ABB9430|nr:oligosaccharide flippase family protein [Cypionkella sp.]MDZ4309657.1 oligosaccharide flippase family protein [Cypionkella sp.]